MPISLDMQDIIYAAVLALIGTWLIKTVSRMFRVAVGRATEFNYHPKQAESVFNRCCALFPNERVLFNGSTFTRGMLVRVVTVQHKQIEGQFIGSNNENIVCVVTESSVVAQELTNIEEIRTM